MKKINLLVGILLISSAALCQIGIGTLTPNSKALLDLTATAPNFKGLLLPRMTATERTGMNLSTLDAGMMVFQTTAPKGTYIFDGTTWINSSSIDAGSSSNNTLRWDGSQSKWVATSNLFNGGGSIGIGSFASISPNYQLQLHSTGASHTRLHITSGATLGTAADGLLIGMGNTTQPGFAHINNQENKPIWFGTNNVERMRIDSVGHVGIGASNPNEQLQLHTSTAISTRMQITAGSSGSLPTDGLVLGLGHVQLPNQAYILQQENKPLWLGTNGAERMRIDSAGRIGIGVSTPADQMHLHAGATNARMLLTAGSTGTTATDGLVIGMGNTQHPSQAYMIQQENKPLWFGTNGTERVRIDSAGRVGIGTSNPSSTLQVNGTFKLGTSGSQLSSIIRTDVSVDPPPMDPMEEWSVEVPLANTNITAVVHASPSTDLEHYSICYARISAPGTLKVKIMYTGTQTDSDLGWITLRVAVIQ